MLFLKHTCICNLYATIDLLIYQYHSLQFINNNNKKKKTAVTLCLIYALS